MLEDLTSRIATMRQTHCPMPKPRDYAQEVPSPDAYAECCNTGPERSRDKQS